ncbi:MAG: hypothetical protein IIT86_09380 [Oscillospiraceae bacterium]|nr:hypothetical protein [Oscillospiraceae bacterium]
MEILLYANMSRQVDSIKKRRANKDEKRARCRQKTLLLPGMLPPVRSSLNDLPLDGSLAAPDLPRAERSITAAIASTAEITEPAYFTADELSDLTVKLVSRLNDAESEVNLKITSLVSGFRKISRPRMFLNKEKSFPSNIVLDCRIIDLK